MLLLDDPAETCETMLRLPPLESLRFFEAAARHQSFARAATELAVTPAAVAHRVRSLENHLDVQLFDRRHRGVVLNARGEAYLNDVQRILAEIHAASERHHTRPRRIRIVAVEAVAEKWLVPRLGTLAAAHPDIAIELETDHRGVDLRRRDFDAWITYTGQTDALRPITRHEGTLLEETLYEDRLLAVCSPDLLAEHGQPHSATELHTWPLLYDLGWDTDWAYWSACQHQPPPDLSQSSGFRLYSMVIDAAVGGLGAAIGRHALIADELRSGTLVPAFTYQRDTPERCCLITTAESRNNPQVQEFRKWILQQAQTDSV